MNTNINKALDELKAIVMALHRSAGMLDDLIQKIELESSTVTDEEYLKVYIKHVYNYRADAKNHKGYSELDEMEADIWARLLADVNNKES